MSDPILEALARIENKTDQTLKNQKEMQAEIAQIRQDIGRISLAVLPEAQRRLLTEKPANYFRQRAEAI